MKADAVAAERRMFQVAWGFFVVAAGLGALLRWHTVRPIEGLVYPYWLHAHSHMAFLGWVYNAFFALAVRWLVPEGARARFGWLFVVTQGATVGMLVTFPVQGYGRESIVFSTLHLIGAAVFAAWLWRGHRAGPVAGRYLRWALGFMLASAIGPLALGPLAAAGLRETPWYPLAVYVYLHFQYNGWFVFFLLAVAVRRAEARGETGVVMAAARALPWLAAGAVATVALSARWMRPPEWVVGVALAGALAQAVGAGRLAPAARALVAGFGPGRVARGLAGLAAGALGLKFALQTAGAWPGLVEVAALRPAVVAFLHLVFLALVTPLLLGWALAEGWARVGRAGGVALALLLAGVAVMEAALFSVPAAAAFGGPAWPAYGLTLAGAALAMLAGAAGLTPGVWGARAGAENGADQRPGSP